MASLELEARKAMLARELLNVESAEILDKIERFFHKNRKRQSLTKVNPAPYTLEEINHRIDEAEEDIAAGLTLTCEEANAQTRNSEIHLLAQNMK